MQRGGREGGGEEIYVARDTPGPLRMAFQVSQTLMYVNPIEVTLRVLFTLINMFTDHLSQIKQ